MNFKVTIKSTGQDDITLDLHDAVIIVKQRECDDLLKVKCIVRPDLWLETRVNAVSKTGVELTHATIIESDPVRDPNHWLKRPDPEVGKYTSLVPDTEAVRGRRYYTKGGKRGR